MHLTTSGGDVIIRRVFRRSSMVEQEAVNFEVAGSSPAAGATKLYKKIFLWKVFLFGIISLCLRKLKIKKVAHILLSQFL